MGEAVRAYYDGNNFVPQMPVHFRKNQLVSVTAIDESESSKDEAREASRQLRGILAGSSLTSESFAAQKQIEIELEG